MRITYFVTWLIVGVGIGLTAAAVSRPTPRNKAAKPSTVEQAARLGFSADEYAEALRLDGLNVKRVRFTDADWRSAKSLLNSRTNNMRHRSMDYLGFQRNTPHAEEALRICKSRLRDPEGLMQGAAMRELRRLAPVEGLAEARRRQHDPDQDVRKMAETIIQLSK